MKKINKFYIALVAILAVYGTFIMTHKMVVISGTSMEPTLRDGQVVISSGFVSVERGNIYCFREPDSGQYAVKRLLGLPGDHVELVDGAAYINGELYSEASGDSWDNQTWDLGADEYLFLGDHRSVSYDGRHWSRPVHLDEIRCELRFIIYPLGFIGEVK